jgi:hypothetical protein
MRAIRVLMPTTMATAVSICFRALPVRRRNAVLLELLLLGLLPVLLVLVLLVLALRDLALLVGPIGAS